MVDRKVLQRAIDKLTSPLRRRINLMISRAIITAVNDSDGLQVLQLTGLANETLDGVERVQEYGFTSHPLAGAIGVLACVAGNRDHGVVVAVDDRRYRLVGLAAGEVALHDDQGQMVIIRRNGITVEGQNIHLKSDGVIRIDGGGVEIHGKTYYQQDVAGLGTRRTHTGGVDFVDDTYTTANMTSGTEHGLDQPEGP